MQVIFMFSLFVLFLFFLSAPGVVFAAAQNGLQLWWEALVPSMLPFFILNELLVAGGAIMLLGRLLERPVRAILKLPGEAAFVLVTGYSTGVPVAAGVVAALHRQGAISTKQAQWLLPFSANVSPVFILSAVSVAMLNAESLGLWLAGIHYGTNFLLMLIITRFFHAESIVGKTTETASAPSPKKLSAMDLGKAVTQSIQTMMLIGGILVIFFILIAFFHRINLPQGLCRIFKLSSSAASCLEAFFSGLMELTAGTNAAAKSSLALQGKIAVISGILAFGGLSSLLQIKAQLHTAAISMKPYLCYKIIQGVLAFTISLFLPLKSPAAAMTPIFAYTAPLPLFRQIFFFLYLLFTLISVILLWRHLYYDDRL